MPDLKNAMARPAGMAGLIFLSVAALSVVGARAQNDLQLETIRKIRANREPTFGTWVYLRDPAITEMLAAEGFDWLIIDMEHTPLSVEAVQSLIVPLTSTKCVPIVRLPKMDEGVIDRLLDAGVLGILFPFIDSRKAAERAVRAVKYPPRGVRGMGYSRAQMWGARVDEAIKRADEGTLVTLLVESKEGAAAIDSILGVPGVDAVEIGTWDMSGSFGVPGKFDDERVRRARTRIEEACRRKNIPIISWALDESQAAEAYRAGSRMISVAGDADFIWRGARKLLGEARRAASAAR
jgi:2-keto-3-deoxy-L-rhamnonate aldolase RhmA